MSTTPSSTDLLRDDLPQSYGSLKTLTTLTFIGCAISYLGLIYSMATWGNYEKQLEQAQENQEKMGDSGMGKFMAGSIEMMQKSHQYRYILLITGLIFTTLCLIGALRMRKLRKSGYPMYVFGELAPILVSAVLLGFSSFGGITIIFSIVIGVLFVILYGTQRKYMIYP